MSWAAVMLFGSGLIFSTGLVWFFVQAWIFAIEAQTVWLIILLTVTTMVAVVSQGYLCAIFVSIPPDPKPRGVTQVNREAFASFPFDATASLVRRKGSGTRPPVGWEVKSSQQLAASLCHPDPGAPLGSDAAASCQAGALEGQAQQRNGGGDIAGGRKFVPVGGGAVGSMETRECTAVAGGAVRSPKSGETLHILAPPADSGLVSRSCGRGVFGTARIASSDAGVTAAAAAGQCVEDVVESGHAGPVLLARTKTNPLSPGPSHSAGGPHAHGESGEKILEEGELGESLGKHDHAAARHRHRHHRRRHYHRHLSQEMKVCSSWTGSARTDATSIGSDDDDDDTAVRFRRGSDGSNGCSETADMDGCTACAKGPAALGVTEQQSATKAEAAVLPPSPLAEQHNSAAAVSGVASGADGGSARPNDETVVRVSELPDVCAICLGQYATGEEVHVLPCLHIFHAECLDVWIRSHPSCPYCKGDLNVIPQENNLSPETSAICYACSVLSGIASYVTRPFGRFFRGFWERRQQREQTAEGGGDREEGEGNEAAEGVVSFAPPALNTPAASHVLPTVVAA